MNLCWEGDVFIIARKLIGADNKCGNVCRKKSFSRNFSALVLTKCDGRGRIFLLPIFSGQIFLEFLSLLLAAAILLDWILVSRLHRKSAQRPNEKSSVLESRPFWRNSKIVWQMSSFTISLKASSFGTNDVINLQTDTVLFHQWVALERNFQYYFLTHIGRISDKFQKIKIS